MLKNLKIIQHNSKKSNKITQQLLKFEDENEINIVAIQEPYAFVKEESCFKVTGYGPEFRFFYCRSNKVQKAVIAVRKVLNCLIDVKHTDLNCVVVIFESLVLVSMYFNLVKSNGNIRDIKTDLSKLSEIVREYANKKVLITCDANSRHEFWDDEKINERGNLFLEFVIDNKLLIINDKKQGVEAE
jgi:hypothetical protein